VGGKLRQALEQRQQQQHHHYSHPPPSCYLVATAMMIEIRLSRIVQVYIYFPTLGVIVDGEAQPQRGKGREMSVVHSTVTSMTVMVLKMVCLIYSLGLGAL